jgi:flagellin-like hook-associated protein FlgL
MPANEAYDFNGNTGYKSTKKNLKRYIRQTKNNIKEAEYRISIAEKALDEVEKEIERYKLYNGE